MTKLILHNYFRSSTSYRVRIALELKQLSYDYKAVHLLNNGGEQNSPTYRKMNAMGGVPTLEIKNSEQNSLFLGQSFSILEYLDEAFPQSYQVFPQDLILKNQVRQFCHNINAEIHPYGNLRTLQYLEKKLNLSEAQRTEWIHHWVRLGLQACEQMLISTSKKYCFGDNITAADLFLVPQIVTAERFKVVTEDFTNIMRIYKNCLQHDAFIKAHPFRQIDTPDDLRIK